MPNKTILLTGGAGFIGVNTADYFLTKKYNVILFDDLSRKGADQNLKWIRGKWGKKIVFVKGDVVCDRELLNKWAAKSDAVIHLAAQVAVTTSVQDPYHDFLVNAQGTLNVLEAIRNAGRHPTLIYASTNKVYGNLDHATVDLTDNGYRYREYPHGIPETTGVDFHSPYGCSKGAADQYVRDYARIYGLNTVVFRQSCIYGPHQFGIEDQGWVAWFEISVLTGRPITIYGDGRQVRDVLYVGDLARLYEMAIRNIGTVSGKIYNIGGGEPQAYSLLQTIAKLERIFKKPIPYSFADWRPGDQKVYISGITKISEDLGWKPQMTFDNGLVRLVKWAKEEEKVLRKHAG